MIYTKQIHLMLLKFERVAIKRNAKKLTPFRKVPKSDKKQFLSPFTEGEDFQKKKTPA